MRKKSRAKIHRPRPLTPMQTLLPALSLAEFTEKIERLPDGRERAVLRPSPYLALELETAGSGRATLLARLLSDRSETVFDLSAGSAAPGMEMLRERLAALRGVCPPIPPEKAVLPARKDIVPARKEKYRLKVSVLEDFTYHPRWTELGSATVRIGDDPPDKDRAEKDEYFE